MKFDNDKQVIAPKIDGAHNTFILRPNKRIDTYSYRKSGRSKNRIDHSYRTDLYKIKSPAKLGETVLRGELFIPGAESHVTGGVLNSNVLKSREKQKKVGKLDNVIFDVVKYRGKQVEDKPYFDKLEMLKEIHRLVPDLKLPYLAKTIKEKEKLYSQIANSKHPQTTEGIVVYNMDESVPTKAKKVKDYDVEVVGIFPASSGSKYDNKAIGGFIGKFEGKGPEIRIGGGLSDELREEAFKNPRKFIGRYAKVKAQSKLPSGKLRMPIFQDWRYEKY